LKLIYPKSHADSRQEFQNRHPGAYSSTVSKNHHYEAIDNARKSSDRAADFEKEHIRYGYEFFLCAQYPGDAMD
jgi:hypothetical protein